MSENPTQPALKTVLEAVNAIGVELHQFRAAVEIRLDKIHSEVKETHSELYALRAEFRELKAEFNEFRSQFKQPA